MESEQDLSSAGSALLLLPTEERHTTSVQALPKMAPIAQYRDRLGGEKGDAQFWGTAVVRGALAVLQV